MIAVVGSDGLVAGLGVPAALDHCHFLASGEVPSDWGLDDTLGWGNRTLHECEVGLGYGTSFELGRKASVGSLGFSDKEQSGSVFVEAVNYAGPGRVSNPSEFGEVREEGVGESAGLVARGGVGGDACRFVDGQQVFILIDDVQGCGAGGGRWDRGLGVGSIWRVSVGFNLWLALAICPLTRTFPSAISCWIAERERSGWREARCLSSLSLAGKRGMGASGSRG